jgi:hypothetical protein
MQSFVNFVSVGSFFAPENIISSRKQLHWEGSLIR